MATSNPSSNIVVRASNQHFDLSWKQLSNQYGCLSTSVMFSPLFTPARSQQSHATLSNVCGLSSKVASGQAAQRSHRECAEGRGLLPHSHSFPYIFSYSPLVTLAMASAVSPFFHCLTSDFNIPEVVTCRLLVVLFRELYNNNGVM